MAFQISFKAIYNPVTNYLRLVQPVPDIVSGNQPWPAIKSSIEFGDFQGMFDFPPGSHHSGVRNFGFPASPTPSGLEHATSWFYRPDISYHIIHTILVGGLEHVFIDIPSFKPRSNRLSPDHGRNGQKAWLATAVCSSAILGNMMETHGKESMEHDGK